MTRQRALLLLALLLPALLVRLAVLQSHTIAPLAFDVRGALSDVMIALLLYGFLLSLLPWSRTAVALLAMLWCALNLLNVEHIRTLGGSADLRNLSYLFDSVFLRASVVPALSTLLNWILLLMVAALLWFALRLPTKKGGGLMLSSCALLGLALISWLPLSLDAPRWRQTHVVHENLLRLIGPYSAQYRTQAVYNGDTDTASIYSQDLSGASLVQHKAKQPNILLLVLEGISGAHIKSLAAVHGFSSTVSMQSLDALAIENLSFSTFISHNRQTNRGLYALLCGDLPSLINTEPKMTQALETEQLHCLPNALREAGYATHYMQAAPIGFMAKDAFMPLAGFEQVHGEAHFPDSNSRNQWGIDDAAFLQQSLATVQTLQDQAQPWFLTLLTVGTHHPYIVPRDFGAQSFPSAAQYLDDAVSEFVEALKEIGVLEDTLVLITSDESVGVTSYRGYRPGEPGEGRAEVDQMSSQLADVWGFLIAMTPARDRARVDAPFSQSDVAISIMDYLDLTDSGPAFIGRSVFRRYETGRSIAFGNLYRQFVGLIRPNSEVYLCRQEFGEMCQRFTAPAGAVFGKPRLALPVTAEVESRLWALVDKSRSLAATNTDTHSTDTAQRSVSLLTRAKQKVRTTTEMYILFGGQSLSVPEHSRISVEIDVALTGAPGAVQLSLRLDSGDGSHFARWLPLMRSGDRLTVALDYYSAKSLNALSLTATVTPRAGTGMLLEFGEARMRLSEVEGSERHAVSVIEVEEMILHPKGVASR
ncbi:MAG: LTA synthase family protein [Pseudomonadota bacterium]